MTSANEPVGPSNRIRQTTPQQGLLVICFFAFISLGLPDGLLGVAWPSIRGDFAQPLDALGYVMVVGTSGYMLSSFFCGALTRTLGVGGLLSASCGGTAVSLLVFATTPWWGLVVAFAFVLGAGAGAIDAALNTYVAKYHRARAMQWMHACFGIGITMGPIIMTVGLSLTGRWENGYLVVASAQLLLATAFFLTRRRWNGIRLDAQSHERETLVTDAPMTESLRTLSALLGMLLFFFYVGLEIGLGLWAFSFLTEARGVDTEIAGVITGSYWAMFTVGRILAGWYTHHISVPRVLHGSFALAGLGLVLLLLDAGPILAVIGFGLTGFAVAPVFPALMSDTESRVGLRHHANTMGMQIAAAGLGAALVPALAGVLGRHFGLGILPLYMLGALALLWLGLIVAHARPVAD